ncbi:hypothetical protein [Methylobacterium thuringiense]|uniref:Histidinol dehydrogenase n=1 Tax=Methylobacterium thuringiense TaxID=1003091 RepID=A0ABQ4TRU2_9HYPH|nr:hypothetical protein [Methylobacterium thuringiense]GJE57746.1 hypothetical protein EKPJFOCH_4264 [Methylobacterium thuringiense]
MTAHVTLDLIETTAKAIDALLTAIDGAPAIGAVTAYRAAITRHGRQLVASIGPSALDAVLDRIKAEAPDKAARQDRERIVALAWEGLAA